MRTRHAITLLLIPTLVVPWAAAELNVSRVGVFSSGVAFIERTGSVEGDAAVELSFRTDQINDILKSLVVEDFDGGTVSVVDYASRDPVEKTLASFAVDITGKPTFGQLLDQLRGEPIRIAAPTSTEGVIVGVERVTRAAGETAYEVEMLNVLSDGGMMTLPIHDLRGVELANPKISAELRKALATLATGRDADKKSVVVNFNGDGERQVRVMYLLEAPIWKTSYRLVVDDEQPYLQGWATVENATEEDWSDVTLSLFSGRPISFRMDLYTPLYVPRPFEELERYASLRPPSFARGDKGLADFADADGAGVATELEVAESGPFSRGARSPAAAPARMRRQAGRAGAPADELSFGAMDTRGVGVQSVADAGDVGELFQYTVSEPVSIARQRSAMLPIVTEDVAIEKVSIFNPANHPKHPLNGMRLTNSTELSLMQGPITVFEDGAYAGDAKLPNMEPGEKRLLAYALDIPVEVSMQNKYREIESRLRIVKGVVYREYKAVDERTYVATNADDRERDLLIEQTRPDGWELVTPKEPADKTDGVYRFALAVPAGKKAELPVRLEQTRDQAIGLSNLNIDQIRIHVRNGKITPEVKAALEKLITLRTDFDRLQRELQEAERKLTEAREEQKRVRDNLHALSRDSDQYQRQMKKFDAYEDDIEKWMVQVDELKAESRRQQATIEQYIQNLSVE